MMKHATPFNEMQKRSKELVIGLDERMNLPLFLSAFVKENFIPNTLK